MKNKIILLFSVLLIFCKAKGQINRAQANLTLTNNSKLEGILKNKDWEETPSTIEFKIIDEKQYKSYTPNDLLSFSFGNVVYISKRVLTEHASTELQDLPYTFPKYDTSVEHVFLKQLFKDKIGLYEYVHSNGVTNFYVEDEHGNFSLLIHKRYIDDESKLVSIDKYKNQLSFYLSGCNKSTQLIEKSSYTSASLTSLFKKYNQCLGAKITHEEKVVIKPNLTLYGGISHSKLHYVEDASKLMSGPTFKPTTSYSFLISCGLPLSKRFQKRQLVAEIGLKNIHSNAIDSIGNDFGYAHIYDVNVQMRFLKVNFLYKYLLMNSDEVKLFVDAGLGFGKAIQNKSFIHVLDNNVFFTNKGHVQTFEGFITLGVGGAYKKISTLLRYEFGNAGSVPTNRSNTQTVYVFVGYRIF